MVLPAPMLARTSVGTGPDHGQLDAMPWCLRWLWVRGAVASAGVVLGCGLSSMRGTGEAQSGHNNADSGTDR